MERKTLILTNLPQEYGVAELQGIFKKYDFTIGVTVDEGQARIQFKNPISASKAYNALKQTFSLKHINLDYEHDPSQQAKDPFADTALATESPQTVKRGSSRQIEAKDQGEAQQSNNTKYPSIFTAKFLGLLLICWALYFYTAHEDLIEETESEKVPAFVKRHTYFQKRNEKKQILKNVVVQNLKKATQKAKPAKVDLGTKSKEKQPKPQPAKNKVQKKVENKQKQANTKTKKPKQRR